MPEPDARPAITGRCGRAPERRRDGRCTCIAPVTDDDLDLDSDDVDLCWRCGRLIQPTEDSE